MSDVVGDGVRWLPTPEGGARCEKLEADGVTCSIYEQRPLACRIFPLAAMYVENARKHLFWMPDVLKACQVCQTGGPERTVRAYLTEQGVHA